MCLTATEVFKQPIKTMIGWKRLDYFDDCYATPYQMLAIDKNQKFLIATGKKDIKNGGYGGGFIHCYKTRKRARESLVGYDRIIKVKCYNVRAFGNNGDLVCDKIEFLWPKKK